ncbi:olfactory receptor 7A5-like [Xenopus laevis]|uniref:Olfactory receptor n=2 Tax=Xenopus laevis TaxID=8355 RepID=A0A974HU21_XENLA|nr:olfactory receptor 7A5-like [Xenopus laevis]OCT90093.1 hypothetical protein XELAEV_18018709mg [Xenopus laevis]
MGNNTIFTYFYILAFSSEGEKQPMLFIAFAIVYLVGVFGNLSIITVTCYDIHLHTSMYFLLANLSFIDICYTTTTLPKLLHILLTSKNIISLPECFTQMFFYTMTAQSEGVLLAFMAYDRYVAVCDPLKYHVIVNIKKCTLIMAGIWTSSLTNCILSASIISQLHFCGSNTIKQYFCDIKYVAQMFCEAIGIYYYLYFGTVIFGVLPLLLCLTSYSKIILCILHIKSVTGRKKTFSTCSSHLAALLLFYGAASWMYMASENPSNVDLLITVIFTAMTPMLNPVIYSLRNKEIKRAIKTLVSGQIIVSTS